MKHWVQQIDNGVQIYGFTMTLQRLRYANEVLFYLSFQKHRHVPSTSS